MTHQCCSCTKEKNDEDDHERISWYSEHWVGFVWFCNTGDQRSCRLHYSRWLTKCSLGSSFHSVTQSVQYCWGELFPWHPCEADADPNPVINCTSKPFTPYVRLVLKCDCCHLGTSQRMLLQFHYFIAWIFTLVKHIYYDQTWFRQRTDRTNSSFRLLLTQCSFA